MAAPAELERGGAPGHRYTRVMRMFHAAVVRRDALYPTVFRPTTGEVITLD